MLSDIEIPYVCLKVNFYITTLKIQNLSILTLIPGHGNLQNDTLKIQEILEKVIWHI
ncbi:MAG: hypothetical protein R3A13_07530 [Bdellovibrionota bacterium]